MVPSAAFCRTQAALQRDRATTSTLENVRRIAASAEAAWLHEEGLAEARERRRARTTPVTVVANDRNEYDLPTDCREPDADEHDEDDVDALLLLGTSENPDRELANR